MKNKSKFLLIASIIINILLFFLISPSNRAVLKSYGLKILGYQSGKVTDFSDTTLITEFKPVSMFLSIDKRKSKLAKYPIIEFHGHLGKFFQTEPKVVTQLLDEYQYQYFVNLNLRSGNDFQEDLLSYSNPKILHFTGFAWNLIQKENGIDQMVDVLRGDFSKGARGVKLWKNFGLEVMNKDGSRLKMDSDLLIPLFQEIQKNKAIVAIHTADPEAFFLPINEKNERYEELLRHPEWSFHDSKYPKFSELMDEREKMFRKYPEILFVSLHFGEYAHDLEKADLLLERNPNVYLDIAARIDELGRHPKSSREFISKWQDRILFGMDGPPDLNKLEIYTRFLETEDEYFDYHPSTKPRKGLWKIYGLGLEDKILKKIYYENAKRILNLN